MNHGPIGLQPIALPLSYTSTSYLSPETFTTDPASKRTAPLLYQYFTVFALMGEILFTTYLVSSRGKTTLKTASRLSSVRGSGGTAGLFVIRFKRGRETNWLNAHE